MNSAAFPAAVKKPVNNIRIANLRENREQIAFMVGRGGVVWSDRGALKNSGAPKGIYEFRLPVRSTKCNPQRNS
jgi:hypothetical protein